MADARAGSKFAPFLHTWSASPPMEIIGSAKCLNRRLVTPLETGVSYNRSMSASHQVTAKTCEHIHEVWRRLGLRYGHPQIRPSGDPRGTLVETILSQHTTDASAARAYSDLRHQFPDWNSVERAPLADLASAIRTAGLATQKATTIQRALRELDGVDLNQLASLPVSEARATLTAIPGIGDKTASCVLLFALGMPAQPVDTHIARVVKRIGIADGAKNPAAIQNVMEACLPSDAQSMFSFHVSMIRHGREVCTARQPRCSACMLTDICDYFAQFGTTSGTRPSRTHSSADGSDQ
jgi:endonuclease-3